MQTERPQTLADLLNEPTDRQRLEAETRVRENNNNNNNSSSKGRSRTQAKQPQKKAAAQQRPPARPRPRTKRRRRRRAPSTPALEGNARQAKSRPAAFAQTCLAFEKHVLRCQAAGVGFQLTPEALLQITHDQAGSKAHHLPQKYNTRDDHDPLKHVLAHSTLCGAGKDASVFRPDVHHYGIRTWPEGCLVPILDSLDRLQQAWEDSAREDAPTSLATDAAVVQELTAPNGRATARFPPPRPLW